MMLAYLHVHFELWMCTARHTVSSESARFFSSSRSACSRCRRTWSASITRRRPIEPPPPRNGLTLAELPPEFDDEASEEANETTSSISRRWACAKKTSATLWKKIFTKDWRQSNCWPPLSQQELRSRLPAQWFVSFSLEEIHSRADTAQCSHESIYEYSTKF